MAKGNEILAYQGNVGLGLGTQGGNVGVYGQTDLEPAMTAIATAAYLNLQKNKTVYEQKLKDRDNSAKEIAAGRLQINNALPKDREKLMQKIQEVKEIYLRNNGDVVSNSDVWLDLQDKLADFNAANVTAKSRYDTVSNGLAEAAAEKNKYKREKMQDHWNKQIDKDIYELVDPYQPSFDWDNKVVQRPLLSTSKELVDKRNGYYRMYERKTDLEASHRDFVNEYQMGDKDVIGLNVDTFLDSFYGNDGILSPQQVQGKISEVNERLRKIAIAEGLDPEKPEALPVYLRPIKARPVNGVMQSDGYKWDDWYKINLYDQYSRKEESEFDEGLLKADKVAKDFALGKERNQLTREDNRSKAALRNAQAEKARAGTKLLNEQTTPKQYYDEITSSGKSKTSLTEGGNYITRVNWMDLSEGAKQALGGLPLTSKDGQNKFVNLVPANVGIKLADGSYRAYSEAEIEAKYKAGLKNNFKGSILDYVKSIGADFDIEAQLNGSEGVGRANRQSSYDRQVKNKGTGKGFIEEDNTPDEVDE